MILLTIAAVSAAIASLSVFVRNTIVSKIEEKKQKPRYKTFDQIVGEQFYNDSAPLNMAKNGQHRFTKIKKELLLKTGLLSIVGESVIYSGEAIGNLLAVNEDVYATISQMTGQQMDSLSDLSQGIHDWQTSWTGGISHQALQNFQGHFAEQVVANHLEQAGHHVVMPDASNQAGYDLIVDGVKVNVKNVTDMGTVHEHFDKYQDIPVITNGQVNGLPEHHYVFDPSHGIEHLSQIAEHKGVIVDNALNHDAVLNHADSASDALTGNIDLHIPYITLALSTLREFDLLASGNTSLADSAKNVSLDVAGIGGGGAVGAKVGGFLGMIGGPIGAAVGAIAGGVVGAIMGRKVTNHVKESKIREYYGSYETQASALKREVDGFPKRYNEHKKSVYRAENYKLMIMSEDSKVKYKEMIRDTKSMFQAGFRIEDQELHEFLSGYRKFLYEKLILLKGEKNKFGFIEKYLWHSERFLNVKTEMEYAANGVKKIDKVNGEIFSIKLNLTQVEKTTMVFSLLTGYGLDKYLESHFKSIKEKKEAMSDELRKFINKEQNRILEERLKAIKKIKKELKNWADKENSRIKELVDRVVNIKDKLNVELKKLGKNTL